MIFRFARSWIARVFSNIPLRVILTVPFALQTAGVVVLTGHFSWRNGEQAGHQGNRPMASQSAESDFDRHAHAASRWLCHNAQNLPD